MKYEYHIETQCLGKWVKIKTGSLHYCRGYLDAHRDNAPRLPYNIMRSDGVLIEALGGRDDVSIGMVAGWPTPEQYEAAADRAIAKAKAIREFNATRPR